MSTVNLGKMLIEYRNKKYCHNINKLHKKYCVSKIIDKHYCDYLKKKLIDCDKNDFKL